MTIYKSTLIQACYLAEQAYSPSPVLAGGYSTPMLLTMVPESDWVNQLVCKDGFPIWGFVAVKDGTAYVCVRGTLTLAEWLEDFSFAFRSWQPHGSVHAGFDGLTNSIIKSVTLALGTVVYSNLCFIGHSLGGAIATLLAAKFQNCNLYTFESPRVGSADFASWFAVSSGVEAVRFANKYDIVTHQPDRPLYNHVGYSVIGDGGFSLDVARSHSLTETCERLIAGLGDLVEGHIIA